MSMTCGAKTSDGGVCGEAPVKGKTRCAAHGGASTGPHKPAKLFGNTSALTFGIYAKGILPSEFSSVPEIAAVHGVDSELLMLRILLIRVLAAEHDFDVRTRMEAGTHGASTVPDYHFPLATIENEESPAGARRKTTRSAVGYTEKILALVKAIGKLELTRAALNAGPRDSLGRAGRMSEYCHHFGLNDEEKAECDSLMNEMHDFGVEAARSLGIELEDEPNG